MQQHSPGQSWGLPSEEPGQQWGPAQYNQPTQGWQQPPSPPIASPPPAHRVRSPKPPKPPKKPATKKETALGLGCLGVIALLLCVLCGTIANAMANHSNASTSSPSPTVAQASVLVATSTFAQPTPTPTQKSTPTPTPTAKPTPRPTPTQVVVRPTPTPTQATGVNGNPWGYNFSPGNLIYNPPSAFCNYFNCISNFWNGHGFINECQDGSYSLSGGIRGDCSYHGGELQPLYSH